MKLQAITVAAFLAVASTDVVDAEQGGVRRKTKEENAAHKQSNAKRELGKNKCDVPIFPTECDGGDLQPKWVGVKGEVCLSAGNSLCRKTHNWQFGVTAPMPPGMDEDDMMNGGNGDMGKDPIPGPAYWAPSPNYSTNNNGGGRRELGNKKWNGQPRPSGPYWNNGETTVLPAELVGQPENLPEPEPLPYNATDASAHLWRGPDCDPVWSFSRPATDVCVGMVGKDDFTNSTFAASSYLAFKNSTYNTDTTTTIDGDYWFIFHPLIGGDWKTMPRLKLDPSIDDGIVMKFKRGPDGKDNEDLLMAIDKDGGTFVNPYGQAFFAPGGDRTQAFEVPLAAVLPSTMTEKMMGKIAVSF